VRTLRFIDNFIKRKLEDARHARDRLALADLFIYEQRQNEILRAQSRLANEIAQSGRAAQSTRAMNQFPHEPRLRAQRLRRKLARLRRDEFIRLADLTAQSVRGSG
jgi:hypothetical protein